MLRLKDLTGLIPVEFPTTRLIDASPQHRAQDINSAFADPDIKAVLATIGGTDQITVIPHLDAQLIHDNPKIFIGYSDNTNLHNWLWQQGITSFYGGSTQVQLGPGPFVDAIHADSLRAALITGGELELTNPGESEDFGVDWAESAALTNFGEREVAEPWTWIGPEKTVRGRTWGGCIQVLTQLALADRLPALEDLQDTIVLLESSEEIPTDLELTMTVRALGERGLFNIVRGIMVARPPVSDFTLRPDVDERRRLRDKHRDIVLEQIARYTDDAVVCFGVPFGHTRPQWIVPHGGYITLDGRAQRVFADYS